MIHVPLTADMEAGYGLAPGEPAERLVAAGAAGLNFEDTDHANHPALQPVEEQARRIAAITAGADLVVNARIDVHIRGGTTEEALERARTATPAPTASIRSAWRTSRRSPRSLRPACQ